MLGSGAAGVREDQAVGQAGADGGVGQERQGRGLGFGGGGDESRQLGERAVGPGVDGEVRGQRGCREFVGSASARVSGQCDAMRCDRMRIPGRVCRGYELRVRLCV